MTTEQVYAYIARTSGCGCVTAICVDEPAYKRSTAQDIAAWIRDGRSVERVLLAEGQALLHTCPHKKALDA